jgi:hypothetical protein
MNELFRKFAQRVSLLVGSAGAFALALLVIVAWAATGPLFGYSDTWQLVINTGTTIVTFLIVFLIQNTQNRDARAIHIKLDELRELLTRPQQHGGCRGPAGRGPSGCTGVPAVERHFDPRQHFSVTSRRRRNRLARLRRQHGDGDRKPARSNTAPRHVRRPACAPQCVQTCMPDPCLHVPGCAYTDPWPVPHMAIAFEPMKPSCQTTCIGADAPS